MTPRPASPPAIAQGCTCPPYAQRREYRVYDLQCPVHREDVRQIVAGWKVQQSAQREATP